MLANKSTRGHANELFETAREMTLIGKTKASGQLNDRFLLQQQCFGTFNTLTKNILMRRNPTLRTYSRSREVSLLEPAEPHMEDQTDSNDVWACY